MKNRIGLHLEHAQPTAESSVAWALFDAESRLLDRGVSTLARVRADAGPAADEAEIFAYVLGTGVMMTEVNIPSRQAKHMRKALPYMIEEHVIGDLRQTHLAVGPQQPAGSVAVAVVAHAQMIAWLEALHGAGLSPTALIPEQLLLPREPGSIYVHIHRERALVRLADCLGLVVAPENLALVLELALSQHPLPCSRIELSACADAPADVECADVLGQQVERRLERPVVRSNYRESLVELLSLGAHAPQVCLNLCRGGYRMDPRGADERAQWRRAGAAIAAGLALFVAVNVAAGAILESGAQRTRGAAQALFHEMFPEERRIINLRRQAESRLAAARAGGGDAIAALAALGRVMAAPEAAGVRLQGLEYEATDGALSAALSASSLEQLYQLEKLPGAAGATLLAPAEEAGTASARLELRAR